MTDLRDLDKRIALKMGLEVISTQEEFDKTKGWDWEMGTPKKYLTVRIWNDNYRGTMWGYSVIPEYSARIEAAIELFEKLGPGWKLEKTSDYWLVWHPHADTEYSGFSASAAIALAFDAVGESK